MFVHSVASSLLLLWIAAPVGAQTKRPPEVVPDSDQDGILDPRDACPTVTYDAGFDSATCGPMDLDPGNDSAPECKARERVAATLLNSGVFVTHIAFSVVKDGELHFADAFEYLGQGKFEHDAEGIHRLYRVGSTTKAITAVTAKILEEQGVLSFGDFVSDDDGTQVLAGGKRTLRNLLSHRGAFKLDSGALHLFCYPGDLAAFWAEPDNLVSPHYDSSKYGNLGGGFAYSAFNFSLAGTYMAHKAQRPFGRVVQERLFDVTGMCTATTDGARAASSPIGLGWGTSQSAVMHVGPAINLYSLTDSLCSDNFYSSDDLLGDSYSWQLYHLDEAAAEPRDPAGGAIASVVDMAHFAEALLGSYKAPGGLVSQQGIRELWSGVSDLGCAPSCPYEPYYGIGFFTDSLAGQPIHQVGHGGSRAGYASAFVLRPEDDEAVCVLANADVSTVALSNLAKAILDDF